MSDLFHHRSWEIYPNDFTAHPDAWRVAWVGTHKDFDGAEDSSDHRCLCGPTVAKVREEIDEWELCNPEKVHDREWLLCEMCNGEGGVPNGPLDGTEKLTFCPACAGYGGWFLDEAQQQLQRYKDSL